MLGSSRGRKGPKKAMDFMPSLRHKATNMENKGDNSMERKKKAVSAKLSTPSFQLRKFYKASLSLSFQ